VERPVKELKGFDRLELQPGKTKQGVFEIPARRMAYDDQAKTYWVVDPITYQVYFGLSSASCDLLHEQFGVLKLPIIDTFPLWL
jgi:beta-glucosidase